MTKVFKGGVSFLTGVATLLTLVPNAMAMQRVDATVHPSGQDVKVAERAVEVAPDVLYLGEVFDEQSGKWVEGYMHITRAENYKRPTNPGPTPGDTSSPTASCYGFISAGAKWKSKENWVVNPTNGYGIADATISDLLTGGIGKWEDAADGKVDGSGVDIFGNGAIDSSANVSTAGTDGRNVVKFGDTSVFGRGIIAITITWGYYNGPTRFREIVEWDQIYNTGYDWSAEAAGVAGKFDFDSIATHELGHAFGMDDLYDTNCIDMTMYGYGGTGETKARDLEDGDINGISALY